MWMKKKLVLSLRMVFFYYTLQNQKNLNQKPKKSLLLETKYCPSIIGGQYGLFFYWLLKCFLTFAITWRSVNLSTVSGCRFLLANDLIFLISATNSFLALPGPKI